MMHIEGLRGQKEGGGKREARSSHDINHNGLLFSDELHQFIPIEDLVFVFLLIVFLVRFGSFSALCCLEDCTDTKAHVTLKI